MANSNEVQTKSSSKAADSLLQEDKIAAKNSKSFILYGPALSMVLAVIALVSALYATYSTFQLRKLSNQQTQNLSTAVDHLQQQQLHINSRLAATTETVKQSQTSLQNHMQDLSKSLQSAIQQYLYQKQDWLLLKARYYLELAQINAHWSDDQQTTITLLQQADALLLTIPDQHLFAVRQAIAKEIAQLKAYPKIDITGLLSQLDATQSVIADLPIKQPFSSNQTSSEKTTEKIAASSWRERLRNSMNVLEKLVVIRRNDKDIQPLVSPLHQTLLRDSIRLNLQAAQWAILQNNPAVYQLSLTQALHDIKRAFDENAVNTQALIKQLQVLQQKKLIATKPVLEASLSLLNQWIESKNSQVINASTTEGDKAP